MSPFLDHLDMTNLRVMSMGIANDSYYWHDILLTPRCSRLLHLSMCVDTLMKSLLSALDASSSKLSSCSDSDPS